MLILFIKMMSSFFVFLKMMKRQTTQAFRKGFTTIHYKHSTRVNQAVRAFFVGASSPSPVETVGK
jgi:hypothetical protein